MYPTTQLAAAIRALPACPSAPQDFSKERLEYENKRKVLFYTDAGCRRMYKDHVLAVSAAQRRGGQAQGGRVKRSGVVMGAGQAAARCTAPSIACHWPVRLSCLPFCRLPSLPWSPQVLERRNTVSGKLYRDDPTIMVRGQGAVNQLGSTPLGSGASDVISFMPCVRFGGACSGTRQQGITQSPCATYTPNSPLPLALCCPLLPIRPST